MAWAFRLSALVKLISDSVLSGFETGAGLTIALTWLPALLGVGGGGHDVPERLLTLAGHLDATNVPTLALGFAALAILICGEQWLPGRPIALAVVAMPILAAGLFYFTGLGVAATGAIPPGLPMPTSTTARSGRHPLVCHGLHAARLYRGRGGRASVRGQAW